METIRGCWSYKELERPIAFLYYDRALVTENDLEQSILDNLQHFLLETEHGFCFEAWQKRLLIDEDYFFADLVFYHRILKCHVSVELKIDKFRHEYASQPNMYINYFKADFYPLFARIYFTIRINGLGLFERYRPKID